MAPEQEMGLEVEKPADVYSLGILLAELGSGHKLFPDSKVPEGSSLGQHKSLRLAPRCFRRIVFQCTNVHPEKRFPDGQALLDALRKDREELLGETAS
jgi:hypothetical protein